MSRVDEVLQKFAAAQAKPKVEQTKLAAAQEQLNQQVVDAFFTTMQASGWTSEGLEKYAQENPQGFQELFQTWVAQQTNEILQAEKLASMEKMAEAERMQKIAEDVYSGRVMAYAFVDELGNILYEMQKMAEEEAKAEEKKEEEKAEEKKEEEKAEEKKEEEKKEEAPPPWAQKKEGSAPQLPPDVAATKLAIEKKASAGYPVTQEELDFLSNCKLALAGYPVKWS